MNYKIVENFLSTIYQFGSEHRMFVAILWLVFMFFLLRKLAKKDNDFYLKDFFKKNKKNQSFGTVTKESNISKKKLTSPQKIDPKKINESERNNTLKLSILLKKNGDCKP